TRTMNQKGISTIVATVLIILITVAGVAIVWISVIPTVKNDLESEELESKVTILTSGGWTVYDAEKGIATVQVERGDDDLEMKGIKILFSINGSSFGSLVIAPDSMETKVYFFNLSDYGEPDSVSVAPIFVIGNSEKEGPVTSKGEVFSGKIYEVTGVVYELEEDYIYEVPMAGLVGWWKFDGNALDSSGDNNGVVHGATLTTGKINQAYNFDGNNDYIDLGTFDIIGGEMTITAWFKADDFDVGDARIISKATSTNEQSHDWMLSTWSGKLRFRVKTDGTTSTMAASSGDLQEGVWIYAVAVYDGSNMILYKNGQQVGSTSKTGIISERDWVSVWVGNNPPSSTSRPFDGIIDEVRIYNRALTQEEVTAIYEFQKED
ncbi:MAG: LamG domain-containing protein, partial [Nanoarchaeota archaeon]|nr:LamG domain-containing protein [Nanoarchaeota archaeon]